MQLKTRAPRAVLCLALSISTVGAATSGLLIALSKPSGFEDVLKLNSFQPPPAPKDALLALPSTCKITPIPAVDDDEARSFEAAAGTSDVVDRSGLTPATKIALQRFERSIASLGGAVSVTSAYRPPAYQAHLQLVWDKWQQLRTRHDPGCEAVRAQVESEFTRHELLASQRPVPVSDHTLGTGFDASVLLGGARGLDRIAASAGIRRPDVRRDPVHFRLIAAKR